VTEERSGSADAGGHECAHKSFHYFRLNDFDGLLNEEDTRYKCLQQLDDFTFTKDQAKIELMQCIIVIKSGILKLKGCALNVDPAEYVEEGDEDK